MGITDCHVHINPVWEMLPVARATISDHHQDFQQIERYLREPELFLAYMDRCGVERSVLINYVSPEVIGYTEKANDFVAEYVRADPKRLVAVGSVHPRRHTDPLRAIWELREKGIRGIKLHPSHQLFAPNEYTPDRGNNTQLGAIYRACEEHRLPVIFHTGTSIFPGARNRYAQPILVEDVAIDYPDLTIVLAHGGRPFWTEEAMFLTRRFKNVYLEVSGVPPEKLLTYFPDLERLSDRVIFGSDWPGPGVKDVADNLARFAKSGLSAETRERILTHNAERVFPR